MVILDRDIYAELLIKNDDRPIHKQETHKRQDKSGETNNTVLVKYSESFPVGPGRNDDNHHRDNL